MYPCALCGKEFPLFGNVLWCNECIDEFLDSREDMDKFIARKRAAL